MLTPSKHSGKLSVKLIKKMKDEMIPREEREVVEIPVLGPLGDKKFWDFKTFPRISKNWSEMNEKD